MSLEDITGTIAGVFEGKDSGLGKTFKIDFGDDGAVYIDASSAPNSVSNDSGDADVTMKISLEDYGKLLAGELDGQMAFMTGKLKVEGDLNGAIALGSYMGSQN